MSEPGGSETSKLGAGWRRSQVAVVAAITLALGFGGGFLVANMSSGDVDSASASGGNWPFFGKPRDAKAKRAGPQRPDGFAVWTTRVDTSSAEPRACIRMSRPLDPRQPYGDFVLVSPQVGPAPAVTASGDELCLAGLGFTDTRVTLLKGLPGRGADKLAANADVDFTFGEKPPYVGFAGDGVILPREEADGVGIETVNVGRLEVEVWRIPDRNLVRKSIVVSEPVGEEDYMGDWGEDYPGDEGRRVWKGEVAVRGETGTRTTTVFPLGAVLKDMKPGGYVLVARDASGTKASDEDDSYRSGIAQARRWIIFTDMALTTYSGSDGLDAVVRSIGTARTLSGLQVSLVAANGETLAEAKSDASGRVRFERALIEGEDGQRAKMVMAYGPQGDLAVLDLDRSPVDLSQQGTGGRTEAASLTSGRALETPIDGYVYADRGIYRPGETAHIVALVRDRAAAAAGGDRKGALVIYRPSGVVYQRFAFDGARDGHVARDLLLPRTAPRGRWSAKLELEGLEAPAGQMSFSVEDFAPQRLAVDADGQAARPVAAGETRAVAVTARFLYGAAGAGLQTQGESRLAADPNPFPAFEGYRFGDEQTPFQEQVPDPITTVTDGAGRAVIPFPSDIAGDTPVPLKATVTASVFEPGGRPVRESVFLKVRPRNLYLGVKIDQRDARGETAPVGLDIIAVDSAGRRRAAAGVTWTLISENWNYDWYQQNGRWQWRRTSRDVAVATGTGDISPARSLRHNRNLGWGDYRLEISGPEGARTVIKFAAGWGSPSKEGDAPDMVRVSAGTKTYAQGDTVEITLKAPYAGEALVAVATDRIIEMQSVRIGENGGTVRLKSGPEWGGGAYVLATVIQPRDPSATPKPRRAVGLAYVPLDPKGRKLSVDIGTPAKLGAKAPVEVRVKVNGLGVGQRARVTIAAVDEGILRLTKFESPDPVKWYFGKRALGVDYRDDYARLLDPNLGAPAQVNFGADEIGGEGLTVTPIKSVALWSGVVTTGLDGKAVVKLPAADFNGELRLMAVAWTDKAVGSGAKAMTVREAVVADLNLPRFLSPGDRATATLELHNIEGKAGTYDAQVTAQGGIVATFRKVLALALGQRNAEPVEVAAPNYAGVGKVAMKVTGPNFTTAKDYPIQSRLGWGPETRTFVDQQRPGEAFTPSPEIMRGLTSGSVQVTVSYSPFRGFDPAAVALALSRYPYGCSEQLVSVAYPLLYANRFTNDPKLKRQAPAALGATISQLVDRQSLDGAFGLWRVGDGQADPWLGAYITDFLLEAKAQGAPVSQEAIDRALTGMKLVSKPEGFANISYRMSYPRWYGRTDREAEEATKRMRSRASAYALYVMAKGQRGDLARLRWWHDVQMRSDPSPVARAQVGAALAMMGDKARARSALRAAVNGLGYREDSDWYQSPTRDLAAVITYAYEAGETELARQLQARLEGAVQDPDSLSTQEQARLLQAAHAMLNASGPVQINTTNTRDLTPVAGQPRWGIAAWNAKFVNAGKGALWRTVTVMGVPTTSPDPSANGIDLSKRLYTLQGGVVDGSAVAQGDRVIVLVSGVSRQGRSMLMVVDDALPAGFEVETVLGPDDAQNGPFRFLGELSTPQIQEKRDDRYIAALDQPGNERFAVAYVARAVTAGNFYMPGAEAKDMYRPSINARTAGGRVAITGRR